MASMAKCENVAAQVATNLGTRIKSKSAGEDTKEGMAYCSGTLNNGLNFSVLDINEGNRCNVEVSSTSITSTINVPSPWTNSTIATRAANAYKGASNN